MMDVISGTHLQNFKILREKFNSVSFVKIEGKLLTREICPS